MNAVTDVDRTAAEELRVALADVCGFWFSPDDTGPLVTALARHREQCEAHLLEKISRSGVRVTATERSSLPADAGLSAPFDRGQTRTRRGPEILPRRA